MARDFDVTCGAINHWENGSRVVPGPVLKLIELYEDYLDEERGVPHSHEQFIRGLSASWSERIGTSFKSMTRVPKKDLERDLESPMRSFLEGYLSKDILKRKIQVTLLRKGIDSIDQMKSLPLKAAQILTYMKPDLAPELRKALSELQYTGRPMAPTVAAKVIYDEFGRRPHEVFAEWSARPFAVASIGQVHRARLHTGEPVAVKIQYPGIKKSIESDFGGLAFLGHIASLLKPLDRGILDHIRDAVLAECDYERELRNIEKFREIFREQQEILIPKAYPEFSRKRVLTMEMVEGESLARFSASAPQDQRDRAGEIIWRFTMSSQLKHGLINADAHAGNFLFQKDRVAFLDFGRVHCVAPESLRDYRDFCVWFALKKREKAREAFSKIPIASKGGTFVFDEFWNALEIQQRHAVCGDPFRFSHEYIAEGMRAMSRLPKDALKLTEEILWVNCASYGLWSVFAELRASARWGDLAVEILAH